MKLIDGVALDRPSWQFPRRLDQDSTYDTSLSELASAEFFALSRTLEAFAYVG
jgi:hypothetical protein